MPKAKLKLQKNDLGKLKLACELNDVKVDDVKGYGEMSTVEVTYRQPQQLFETGRYIDSIQVSKVDSKT